MSEFQIYLFTRLDDLRSVSLTFSIGFFIAAILSFLIGSYVGEEIEVVKRRFLIFLSSAILFVFAFCLTSTTKDMDKIMGIDATNQSGGSGK